MYTTRSTYLVSLSIQFLAARDTVASSICICIGYKVFVFVLLFFLPMNEEDDRLPPPARFVVIIVVVVFLFHVTVAIGQKLADDKIDRFLANAHNDKFLLRART